MANPHGVPIWYELMSADPDASRRFYDEVIGWAIEAQPSGDMDYRMIATPDGNLGGVMRLTAEMRAGGAVPGWLFYIGVDDVDASAEAIKSAGGAIVMGPWTIPGIGRMAVATDPQGIPFYIMRGDGDQSSTSFDRNGMGKCNWNELVTPDETAGNAFYVSVFGWSYPDKMTLPAGMGDYSFVHVGETVIGATMRGGADSSPGWRFYFRAPDIEAAAAKVTSNLGKVLMGPHAVPGGDRIILATDPQGVVFGVVGPGEPG